MNKKSLRFLSLSSIAVLSIAYLKNYINKAITKIFAMEDIEWDEEQ
jgi:hypothetical protein